MAWKNQERTGMEGRMETNGKVIGERRGAEEETKLCCF
jgi:hypothetical protein